MGSMTDVSGQPPSKPGINRATRSTFRLAPRSRFALKWSVSREILGPYVLPLRPR